MLRRFFEPIALIKRATRWFFAAPFQFLPPAFGDTVPVELRVYEAQADEMTHHPIGTAQQAIGHGYRRNKPTQ
jgi:hypothetical protein